LYVRIASGGSIPGANWFHSTLYHFFPSLNIDINEYIQQILGLVINNIGSIFSKVLSIGATFCLSFFALYYFLKDGAALRDGVLARSPLPKRDMEEILDTLRSMTSSVIRGSLLVGVFYGIFTGLGFFVFGLPSAILWGGVTVIASFIPVFGVLLIVVPGILSLAIGGNIIAAVGLTAWLFVMSASVESFVRPWLIGHKAKIHPMLMLFAVLGGLSFFGPIGLLLGPLALSLLLTLLEIYPLFVVDTSKAVSKAK
jgi:predicted PurR-regulated permease PerM